MNQQPTDIIALTEVLPRFKIERHFNSKGLAQTLLSTLKKMAGLPRVRATAQVGVTSGELGDMVMTTKRCDWAGSDPLYVAYHDTEWGVPIYDDDKIFEFLILEGAQAGLSWITVLRKRENYRRALHGFDARKIAAYTDTDVARLLSNEGIIRNRLKISATIDNARAFLEVQAEFGKFSDYLWRFVDGKSIQNRHRSLADIPASTSVSDAMSKDLKRRGFRFVGSTICYAHMQATGMVNDHLVGCFRHAEVMR